MRTLHISISRSICEKQRDEKKCSRAAQNRTSLISNLSEFSRMHMTRDLYHTEMACKGRVQAEVCNAYIVYFKQDKCGRCLIHSHSFSSGSFFVCVFVAAAAAAAATATDTAVAIACQNREEKQHT